MTLIQTKQKRAGREQRNKYKPRTETSTKQEQKQEQHLTIRHAGRPADLSSTCLSVLVSDLSRTGHLSPTRLPYGSEFSNFSLCTLSKLPPLASPCLPLPPLASPCLPLPPLASPCLPLPPLASPCLPLPPLVPQSSPQPSPCFRLVTNLYPCLPVAKRSRSYSSVKRLLAVERV